MKETWGKLTRGIRRGLALFKRKLPFYPWHSRAAIVRYGIVGSLGLCGYWIGRDRDSAEPYITTLGALIAFIANDIAWFRPPSHDKADKKLFTAFSQTWPAGRCIQFLRHHDFGGSFHGESFHEAEVFRREWNVPQREFLDIRIEEKRKLLFEATDEFLRSLALNTFPLGTHGQFGVPPEWNHEQPERFRKVEEELNRLAGDLAKRYDEFVRLARQILGDCDESEKEPY